ncbi:DNA polymerase delta subunit 3-like [Manduca sexta]|uniref:DNA polymerase delta subunit 3-like n=1 Tax=Manduca sexta TaxID=7130 RepID=UPI00188FC77E|nr:DNA polymerase delta subunit 3-like [Manduca sexta]
MEENIKHLKEIILDENRIVTYISISKELCVHVNEAKQLLQDVVEAIKKEQPDVKLNINYLVSGLSDTNKGQVIICPDRDLKKLRETFKLIFFSHMYSVNKGCNLLDKVAYTSINTFEDIPLCIGLIKNDYCLKRTTGEISSLKTNSHPICQLQKMLMVLHKIQKENKLEIKTEKVETVKLEKMDVEESSVNENKNTVYIKESPVNGTKNKKADVKKSPEHSTKSKKSNNLIKPSTKVDKRRKRVLHVSDSESDHEENDPFTEQMNVDNESDDEIPPTPTVNTVKITSGIVNPKKRRKIVDKTYTDEDGYILTKKEEVYVSCSENEEETAKKENVENKTTNKIEVSPKGKHTKAPKKKISPPQKGKQATMTNFFKKV